MTWLSHLFGSKAPRAGSHRLRPGRLGIERLEDRTVPANVFVVPLNALANNTSTFYTLEDAIKTAGTNGLVTVEPGAVADFNIDVTQNGLTIQGDPNVPSSILPAYNISIDANNVTLKNLNINFVSVDPGFSGLTVTHSTVNSVFVSGGPTGNGNNRITESTITSDITIIGNTNIGVATNDKITNNTFTSFASSLISVSSDNGAVIQNNTLNGGGAITTDTSGNSITKAPQTGIEIDGGTNVMVQNNTIDLAGQNGAPGGTTGSFIGIDVSPFNPATAGLPAGTPAAAPTVQVLNNSIVTGRGIGLNLTAPTTPTGDRDLQVLVQGNDFHNNLIGVRYIGNNGGSITTDLGGGSLGSLGGNDFRGFTTRGSPTNAAIVLQGVGSGAVLTAEANMFANTVTPSNVVDALAGSINVSKALTANQAFVQALYNQMLGYTGAAGDLAYWTNVLTTSGQAAVVNGIGTSQASLDRVINGLYLKYLNRPADSAGLAYWYGQFQNGVTLEQVEAGILSSQEFLSDNNSDYVQGLFIDVLGRTGTGSDLAYWYGQLPSLGLAGVASGFTSSLEYRKDFITTFFQAHLHRTPSATDLAYWSSQPGDLLTLAGQILDSSEFFNNG